MTGAVFVYKNEIISNGCAHASSFRLRELASIHAEIHCLARSRHLNLTGAVAYVMTMARKSGNLTFSMPCIVCAIALRSAGIKEAIYTTENGAFSKINLEKDLSHLKVYTRRNEI
jgi:tRNA(Arg) A34 adenosine deaminase TadA